MIDQATQLMQLGNVASLSSAGAVVTTNGVEAVVIAAVDQTQVRVWADNQVQTWPSSQDVVPVTDSAQQRAALVRAVSSLEAMWRETGKRAAAESARHGQVLDDIRVYALDAHLDGSICCEGLNRFLCRFDLPEYEPFVRLDFTLSGRVTLTDTDSNGATAAVLAHLGAVLDGLQGVDDDSVELVGAVQSAEPVELVDGTGVCVTFSLAGQYDLDGDDEYDAVADCRNHLEPDLGALEGIVPDSLSFSFDSVTTDLIAE